MKRSALCLLLLCGCSKGVSVSEIPAQALSYECKYRSSSTLHSKAPDNYPLVAANMAGVYEEIALQSNAKSIKYTARISVPNFDKKNPPKIWACDSVYRRELECGSKVLSEEKDLRSECRRVKQVRYTGAEMIVDCGTLDGVHEELVGVDGRIYKTVRVMM